MLWDDNHPPGGGAGGLRINLNFMEFHRLAWFWKWGGEAGSSRIIENQCNSLDLHGFGCGALWNSMDLYGFPSEGQRGLSDRHQVTVTRTLSGT